MITKPITITLAIQSRINPAYKIVGLKNAESVTVSTQNPVGRTEQKRVGDILNSKEVRELNNTRNSTLVIR